MRELDSSPTPSTSCPVWAVGKSGRPKDGKTMDALVAAIQARSGELVREGEFQKSEKQHSRPSAQCCEPERPWRRASCLI